MYPKLLSVLALLFFVNTVSFAAPQVGVLQGASQDASSVNIPAAFTANSQVVSGLVNKSHLAVINTTAGNIAVSVRGLISCGSATDDILVQANSSIALDNVALNGRICIRSLTGSAIATGIVYVSTW